MSALAVFVVNLDSQPERWKRTMDKFAKTKLKLSDKSRHPATVGETIRNNTDKATPLASLLCSNGMLGCFDSHRRIWQSIVDRKLDVALVFEDDVQPVSGFDDKLASAMQRIEQFKKKSGQAWDVVYLANHLSVDLQEISPIEFSMAGITHANPRQLAPGLHVPTCPTGTFAYLVSSQGARRLLECLPRVNYHVDLAIAHLSAQGKLQVWSLEPYLVEHIYTNESLGVQHSKWLLGDFPLLPGHTNATVSWCMHENVFKNFNIGHFLLANSATAMGTVTVAALAAYKSKPTLSASILGIGLGIGVGLNLGIISLTRQMLK